MRSGYYFGQLHFYHTTWIFLAVAFIGAVADGTDVLPGAADATILGLNNLYGLIYLLFMCSSMMPLFAVLLTEEGIVAAITAMVDQLWRGSPFFFVFQSRCIGHYFSGEMASGGAAYIPTGRSLAIQRQPFALLYASFATACLYPGLDVALLLGGIKLASPEVELFLTTILFSGSTAFALLFSTAMFNPRLLAAHLLVADVRGFYLWLKDPKAGWSKFHADIIAKKSGSEPRSIILPSKEMLVSIPLLLIVQQTMRRRGWTTGHLVLLALPLVCASFVGMGLLLRHVLVRRYLCKGGKLADAKRLAIPWYRVHVLAPLAALAIVGEAAAVALPAHLNGNYLSISQWIALVSARYFTWRWVANAAAYAPFGPLARVSKDLASTQSASGASSGHPERAVHGVGHRCRTVLSGLAAMLGELAMQTVGAVALLADVLLGVALQLPVLAIAVLPLSSAFHFLCLFSATSGELAASFHSLGLGRKDLQQSGSGDVTRRRRSSRFAVNGRGAQSFGRSESARFLRRLQTLAAKATLAEPGSNAEDESTTGEARTPSFANSLTCSMIAQGKGRALDADEERESRFVRLPLRPSAAPPPPSAPFSGRKSSMRRTASARLSRLSNGTALLSKRSSAPSCIASTSTTSFASSESSLCLSESDSEGGDVEAESLLAGSPALAGTGTCCRCSSVATTTAPSEPGTQPRASRKPSIKHVMVEMQSAARQSVIATSTVDSTLPSPTTGSRKTLTRHCTFAEDVEQTERALQATGERAASSTAAESEGQGAITLSVSDAPQARYSLMGWMSKKRPPSLDAMKQPSSWMSEWSSPESPDDSVLSARSPARRKRSWGVHRTSGPQIPAVSTVSPAVPDEDNLNGIAHAALTQFLAEEPAAEPLLRISHAVKTTRLYSCYRYHEDSVAPLEPSSVASPGRGRSSMVTSTRPKTVTKVRSE